jgi:hypothetical protein
VYGLGFGFPLRGLPAGDNLAGFEPVGLEPVDLEPVGLEPVGLEPLPDFLKLAPSRRGSLVFIPMEKRKHSMCFRVERSGALCVGLFWDEKPAVNPRFEQPKDHDGSVSEGQKVVFDQEKIGVSSLFE